MPALPVAISFLGAALIVGAGPLLKHRRETIDAMALLVACTVAALCGALMVASSQAPIVYWFGGWRPRDGVALGISFAIFPLGAGLAAMAAILTAASLVFSWRYFEAIKTLFHALMLVFLGAMVGFCLTGDLFNMFVFFELMGVSAYALTGYKAEEESLQGALNFCTTNSVGGYLILTGLGFLYGRTGALNIAQIGRTLGEAPPDGLVIAAFVLLTAGFCVKAAVFPFHFWLADAHAVAPTPVCVLFSGVMVELGIYAVARLYWAIFEGPFGPYSEPLRTLLVWAGVLTAVVGAIMCHGQRHVKRLLAFSTVSHVGLLMIGIALLERRALAGVSIYILSHGLLKAGLFMGSGILLHRFSTVDEMDLLGRGRHMRWTRLLFLFGGLGLAGTPPFGTCLGKALLEEAAKSAHRGWLSIVFIGASIVTGAAVLRVAGRTFFGWGKLAGEEIEGASGREAPETNGSHAVTPWVMLVPAGVLVSAAFMIGLIPGLAGHAESAAGVFTDRRAYAEAVLEGHVRPLPSPSHISDLGATGLLAGALSGAGALALALLSLFGHRLPRSRRPGLTGVMHTLLRIMRRMHSGHVGDAVAWLVLGTAVLGAAVAMAVR